MVAAHAAGACTVAENTAVRPSVASRGNIRQMCVLPVTQCDLDGLLHPFKTHLPVYKVGWLILKKLGQGLGPEPGSSSINIGDTRYRVRC